MTPRLAKRLRAAGSEDDPLVSRLAARLEPAMRRAFLAAVRGAAGAVDLAALESALASGQVSAAEAVLRLERMGEALRAAADPLLGRTFVLGVAAGAQAANLRSGLAYGFDLVNPESIAWVRARGAQLVTEVDQSTRRAIQEMVEAGIREGRAPDVLAREIVEIVGLRSDQVAAVERFRARLVAQGVAPARVEARAARYADAQLRWRGELIARTETQAAANAGQTQLWQAAARAGDLDPGRTRRVWIVTHDDRLEPLCEALDGEEADLGGPFPGGVMDPPLHPACLPAGALVAPGPKITGQTERVYEGDLCVLRTASGQRLAVTPNHPVLTPRGWAPAHRVYEIGHVVRRVLRHGAPMPFDLDHQDIPAMIEQIAEAFHRSARVAAATLPLSAEDFHGDGIDGQVAVVRADRLLLCNLEATGAQHRGESVLVGAGVETETLDGRGMQRLLSRRFRAPGTRRMGGLDLVGALGRRHVGPFSEFRGGSPADWFAALYKSPADNVAADAELARNLLLGGAGSVALDHVVGVDVVPFHGVVYNLQTIGGWYIANSIITHNCRCATGLVFK